MPRAERLPLTLQALPLAADQRLLLVHDRAGVAGAVQCRDAVSYTHLIGLFTRRRTDEASLLLRESHDRGRALGGDALPLARRAAAVQALVHIQRQELDDAPVSYTHLDVYKRQVVETDSHSAIFNWCVNEYCD